MSEPSQLALNAAGGLLLGAAYFAGLWWTVRLAVGSKAPAAWFAASFALRAALTCGGFWLIAQQGAAALLVSLGGFVVARVAATRLLGGGDKVGAEVPPCD